MGRAFPGEGWARELFSESVGSGEEFHGRGGLGNYFLKNYYG
jgi:hypothetical protein